MTTELLVRAVDPGGVFDREDELRVAGHEMVSFVQDPETGLRAIISVHSTTLGPALGGTRFHPYVDEAAALTDVLRLSQGMTFKAAVAGLPLGGGKAVIVGDPTRDKTPALLRAYGRFVDRLGGAYITAADVGTTSADLDVVGEVTPHVVGRSRGAGGSGDSGYSTAFGVFSALRAAAAVVWGRTGLEGRRVGVEGAGKVGFHLVDLLLREGAAVVAADPSEPALRRVQEAHSEVVVAHDVREHALDVYAPCAMGGTLTEASVASLDVAMVCGAANNQLADSSVGDALAARGIVWVPDFVANAGGLIQVGGELQNRSEADVLTDVAGIGDTVAEILLASREDGMRTARTAIRIAERRIRTAAVAAGEARP